jgi:TolA-binding protein
MKKMMFAAVVVAALAAFAQDKGAPAPGDRAARQAEVRAKRMIQQAVSILKEGEESRAMSMLAAVPKMYPGSQQRFVAWLEIGRCDLSKGRFDEALASLRKAESATDGEVRAESIFLQAKVAMAKAHDSEAAMLLRRVTSDFPNSLFANDAWYEIGQIHFKAKRWVRAREAFGRVGTAVPKSETAEGDAGVSAVFAEAGQRLFVCVDDRDLAVAAALGKKVSVKATAASGDVETLELVPFGVQKISALASVPTSAEPTAAEDGRLTVQGGETVTVTYVDEANAAGENRVTLTAPVKIVSTAVLSVMDGAYRQSVKGVFAGNAAFVRLRDLDLDTTPQPDKATVSVTSYKKRPKPTDEELAEAAKRGEALDPDADPWIEIGTAQLVLVENAPRSGVFDGRILPVVGDGPFGEGEVGVDRDGKLVFSFVDERHLDGNLPRTVESDVLVLTGGSTEPQSIVSSASDPVLQSRKLLLEARLLNQWGTIFKDVGLDAQARSKADEGLQRVADIFALSKRHALVREVIEQAYAVKWDLLLVRSDLNGAIAVCRELLRVYPDTLLADVAFLRIAKARAESRDLRDLNEAARIYRSVLGIATSNNRAEAQYLLAQVLEKIAKLRTPVDREPDFTAAIAAYRACAENYPQSSFAGESFKRVITYQIEKKDYDRAIETLDRVFQDYPDAPWLDEMMLRWGIVLYRRGDRDGAVQKFRSILEEYPSGAAAGQAKTFIERLSK